MPPYTVQRRDPRRVADAVIRYQLAQPRLALTVAVVALVAVFGGASAGVGGAVLAALAVVVLVSLVVLYKRGQLAKTLGRRGFRPGTALDATMDETGLTVTTPDGSGRHPWTEIEHVRVIKDVVLFRPAAARFVVALPVEALPDGALERVLGPA
ncbi:hypothetical protein [uncultured Jatrophihabitans sp.]|uniref:hypothetical protein n=1 Tax=uncultured Jatrophihabitans sp. TaxID=1610747 RepID=UPI0035CC6B34